MVTAILAAFAGAVIGDGLSFLLGYHQRERVTAQWPLSRHPEWLARGHASSSGTARCRSCWVASWGR